MANGPVAMPATRLAAQAASSQLPNRCTATMGQGAANSRMRRGQTSTRATRAAVAANDIWNPGVTTASGRSNSTTKAAAASARIVTACRSANTARKAMEAVTAARSAGGGDPEITRYVPTAIRPAIAATFLPDTRNASHGHIATSRRTAKKTKPPTTAMCRPEIDRMCASPESRMASRSGLWIQVSCPVVMAAATPPVRSPRRATIRSARA